MTTVGNDGWTTEELAAHQRRMERILSPDYDAFAEVSAVSQHIGRAMSCWCQERESLSREDLTPVVLAGWPATDRADLEKAMHGISSVYYVYTDSYGGRSGRYPSRHAPWKNTRRNFDADEAEAYRRVNQAWLARVPYVDPVMTASFDEVNAAIAQVIYLRRLGREEVAQTIEKALTARTNPRWTTNRRAVRRLSAWL